MDAAVAGDRTAGGLCRRRGREWRWHSSRGPRLHLHADACERGSLRSGGTADVSKRGERGVVRTRVFVRGDGVHLRVGISDLGAPAICRPGRLRERRFSHRTGMRGVEVTGPGLPQPVQIPIAYASFGQINAQMPEFTGTGPVTLTVDSNPGIGSGVSSAVATLNSLQPFAPAFFVFPNSTSIAAEEAETDRMVADSSVVAGASPAKPGDVVSLFGTGFGDTESRGCSRGNWPLEWPLDEFHHSHDRRHHARVI